MSIDELSKWDTHFLLNSYWVVYVSTDAEELGSGISFSTHSIEPGCTSSHDGWDNGDSLDVSHGGWATIKTSISWEWWLQSWLSGLSFKGLDES